jgi:hypothetical protein
MAIVLDPLGLSNASAPVRKVVESLDDVKVTESGWSALCPVHDDHNPSLSVAEGSDGQVLLFCHAGCDVLDVAQALGMEMRDLFVRRRRSKRGGI